MNYLSFKNPISADPKHKNDVKQLIGLLKTLEAGCGVKIEKTKGHPTAYGENIISKESPIQVYGHYDVQPPDPRICGKIQSELQNKIHPGDTEDHDDKGFLYVQCFKF